MNERAIRDIVVIGGGTAGWMAAAAFSTLLPKSTRVVLIESEEIGTVGVGEATIPPLQAFNHMVGINEDAFLAASQGSFKLGIEFVGWGAEGERYFHPFGPYGQNLRGVQFHQLYLRELQRRPMPDIREWSMSGAAALLGRFWRPDEQTPMPAAQISYAFHFDAGLYARFLRTHAERHGVQRLEGRIVDVALDGDTGHVSGVTLADGRTVSGELFIDCSGFRGLLIEDKLKTGYEDWAHWLPCDRAIAVPTRLDAAPEPFTRATARSAGWQWRIPLQHRIGNGLVYSSAHLEREDAEALLLANLESEPIGEPRHLAFKAGRRRLAWNGNVVSLGLSSGFIEPLESTSIHLIQSGVAKLLALFPDLDFDPAERDEYNRQMREVFEDVRDFIILHFKVTRRTDSAFWNHCRTMDVPNRLAARLELWRSKGRIFREGAELFGTASWVAVLLGQGMIPDSPEPSAFAADDAMVADLLERMRSSYRSTAERLPTHAEFIAGVCAAAPVTPR